MSLGEGMESPFPEDWETTFRRSKYMSSGSSDLRCQVIVAGIPAIRDSGGSSNVKPAYETMKW